MGFYENYDAGSPDDPALSVWPLSANPTLLYNSGFAGVCTDDANHLKDWTVAVGTAGTHVAPGTRAQSHATEGCLRLISDGSTLASVYQQFNLAHSNLAGAGGTPDTLAVSTTYTMIAWLKISATDTAGTVIFELVDGAGAVHNSNQFTVNVNTLTTSHARKVFTFTTAGSLPAVQRLRVRFGSSPTSGRTVYVGSLVFYSMTSRLDTLVYYAIPARSEGGTIYYFDTWDQLFCGHIASGRGGLEPFPLEDYYMAADLTLNVAERNALAGATANYDLHLSRPHRAARIPSNFRFVRGMYE
jgi:hypothetical protein